MCSQEDDPSQHDDPEPCGHKRVVKDDNGINAFWVCADCDQQVALTGPEDDLGIPSWEAVELF